MPKGRGGKEGGFRINEGVGISKNFNKQGLELAWGGKWSFCNFLINAG